MGELSKKEKNRISSTLSQSRLKLFDMEDRKPLKVISEDVYNSMSRCTGSIKQILDIFMCSSIKPYYNNLLNSIDTKGVSNIAKVCSLLEENKDSLGKITIRTIFGGTEAMPFRALVYLLPAINLCEEIKKNNNGIELPNIEFVFMNQAGILANSLNPEKVEYTTSQFIEVAKRYLDEYHPNLKNKVNFYVDKSFTCDIINTQEYRRTLEILESKLINNESLKNELLNMGKRRNASTNSIKYAALHTFVQDGRIYPGVAKMDNYFGGIEQQDSDLIISIGARPEETFFKVRKLIANSVSDIYFFNSKETAQYIAGINVPPYSPLTEGELFLDDVLENSELIYNARKVNKKNKEYCDYQTPVQKSVEAIINDTQFSESDKDIKEFMTECKKIKKLTL